MELEWITVSEAAQRCGVAPATIRWDILKGRIKPDERRKSGKVWLVRTSAVERLYIQKRY